MTHILWAVYDPSRASPEGSYWIWRSPGLDLAMLDELYYDTIKESRPPNVNQLNPEDIWGGVAGTRQGSICVYRYLNGGRDQRDRPNRFVVVAAFVSIEDSGDADLLPLLRLSVFQWMAEKAATQCPAPQPPTLEESIALPTAHADPVLIARAIDEGRIERRGVTAPQDVILAGVSLPEGWRWHCHIRQTSQEQIGVLQCHAPQAVQAEPATTHQPSIREMQTAKQNVTNKSHMRRVLHPAVWPPLLGTVMVLVVAVLASSFLWTYLTSHSSTRTAEVPAKDNELSRSEKCGPGSVSTFKETPHSDQPPTAHKDDGSHGLRTEKLLGNGTTAQNSNSSSQADSGHAIDYHEPTEENGPTSGLYLSIGFILVGVLGFTIGFLTGLPVCIHRRTQHPMKSRADHRASKEY